MLLKNNTLVIGCLGHFTIKHATLSKALMSINIVQFRQLVLARDRIKTGLQKLLETNELVVSMEVGAFESLE